MVSVDAGCDPDYQFNDLANAIRKCWTDFGTRIEIDVKELRPQGKTKHSTSHVAVGTIYMPMTSACRPLSWKLCSRLDARVDSES